MHSEPDNRRNLVALRERINRAADYLPAQGPISVFVHHNTLHAFESQNFFDALRAASQIYGCQPLLSEDEYRSEMAAGRIAKLDIEHALIEDLGERDDELIEFLGTRFGLRYAMLENPIRSAPLAELRWLISETDALSKFRPEVAAEIKAQSIYLTRRWILGEISNPPHDQSRRIAAVEELLKRIGDGSPEAWPKSRWESFTLQLIWRACNQGVHALPRFQDGATTAIRHRDWLHAATGQDIDRPIHDVLGRYCAAFLDQGLAHWPLPFRDEGFFQSFIQNYSVARISPNQSLRGLGSALRQLQQQQMDPLQSIAESLDCLGVHEKEQEPFLAATLLALRGWAGMIHQMETRGDRVARAAPLGSLVEFLAIRLILERVALTNMARDSIGYTGPLAELRRMLRSVGRRRDDASVTSRAFLVFQLAQLRGWTPESMFRLNKSQWSKLLFEMESFSGFERRKVFQLALERNYRQQVLDGLVAHTNLSWLPRSKATRPQPDAKLSHPSFQIVTCIDDRCESLRRHLEEVDPACETFGVAGFFAVPMYYQGAGDAYFVPLCPIVVTPTNFVREEVTAQWKEQHELRANARRQLGRRSHSLHRISRTTLGGIVSAFLGPFASVPLVARVLFPRPTAWIRRRFGSLLLPPGATELTLLRIADAPGPSSEQLGFSLVEMVDNVERLLRDIGLTHTFARLVVVCGHGSSSLNNPHESAYNCGACGGGRGGPNARAITQMANDPRVRVALESHGMRIPADTVFVAAYHNTCNDRIEIMDEPSIPQSHANELSTFMPTMREALAFNAQERCRRFESAELSIAPGDAIKHVDERAEDLAQTRPEYNHATNAVCFVGRRSRTRGLFLDRRCFLVSYDPRYDDEESAIVTRILQAVIPVCAGINLEYYFSRVDVAGFGCGTKLPHNVTSLIGVMDGAASDLRTGLAAQMTEIHDPLRLLVIVETTPLAFLGIMKRNPAIQRLTENGWVQLATLDPESAEIHVLRNKQFVRHQVESRELPQVATSRKWYRGWRGNLGLAHISQGISADPTAR